MLVVAAMHMASVRQQGIDNMAKANTTRRHKAALLQQSLSLLSFPRACFPLEGFYLTLQKGMHNYRPGMQHRQDVEEKPSK